MEKIRYGLLGTGGISVQHLEAAKLLGDCMEIVALCDVDEKSLAEKGERYGIKRLYNRIEEFLQDPEVDVVTILTPPHIRKQVVMPCLQAGKHVFVEKPFSLTLEEAQEMVEAASASGCWIGVNQNYRWRPEVQRMRFIIENGLIGEVLMMNMNQSFWRDEQQGWRNTTEYLAMSVMGVHWLDRFRWLTMDEPRSLFSSFRTSGLLSSKGEDITSVVVNFNRGAIATLTHSWVSRAIRGEADNTEIIGTRGTIVQKAERVRLYLQNTDEIKEWLTYNPSEERSKVFVESFADSLRTFTNDIQKNQESCISGADNLKTMALVDGSYRSSVTQQPVHFSFG